MSHRRAIAGADGWTPLSPGGLVAWYDAGAAGTCFQDAAISFTAACKHYLSVADNASISATTVLDLFCWVYLDSMGANRPFVVKGTSLSAAANLEYGLYYSHTGTNFKFSVSNGSMITTVTDTGAAPSISTWYFLHAGLRADGTLFISRNNAAEVTSASCPAIQDSTNALCLGGYGDLATYHNGRLDSIALTKTSASSAETTALYNSGAGRRSADCTAANNLDTFWANCVSWWDGSETSGTRYDAKGTNHLSETFDDIISSTVLNGGFETLGGGGADVFGSWTEGVAGSSTINAETTAPYAGTYACRMDIDVASSLAYVSSPTVLTTGKKYTVSLYSKTNTGTSFVYVAIGTTDSNHSLAINTTYGLVSYSGICSGTGKLYVLATAASKSIFSDDVTVRSAEIVSAAGIAQGACADTNPVAKWTDQSGNSRHLTQTDLTKRLVYRTAQQNGRPALVGVGGDDSLSIASDLIGTGNVTLCAVAKAAGTGGAARGRLVDNDNTFLCFATLGRFQFSSGAVISSANDAYTIGVPVVVIVTRTNAGVANFYVNGLLSGTADQSCGTPLAKTATYLGNSTAADHGLDGNLYEALIWTGILSAADIASLTAYARNWWNF